MRTIFSRRSVLAQALGSAGAVFAHSGSMAKATPAGRLPDISRPDERLRVFMLMRGALDERLVVSCIECTYSGNTGEQLTPFYDLVAATFARYRPAPDGGYDAFSYEIEYFIDRETGDVLDAWKNPYTGKTVFAKHTGSQPMRYRIGPNCEITKLPPPRVPGTTMAHATLPLRVIGNDVWSIETTTASVPVAGSKPLLFNENVINHARLSDFANTDAKRVGADVTYIGVSSFRPWQEMGDHAGGMIGVGHGSVGVDLKDLPAKWISATRSRQPEALVNPGSYLDALWKRP